MINRIEFALDIVPKAKQSVAFDGRKGGQKGYTDPKKKSYVKDLIWRIREQKPRGFKRWTTPVSVLRLLFKFPFPKETRKWQLELFYKGHIFPYAVQMNDLDNLCKPLFDACTKAGVYVDDGKIWRQINVQSVYHTKPGIELELSSALPEMVVDIEWTQEEFRRHKS